MLVKDFLDYWLTNVIKGNIRENSYTIYRGYIKNHINKEIGDIDLTDLKPDIIQKFVVNLQNGKHCFLCAKAVKLIFSMLNSALKCAIEYEYIEKNPCQKIRLPRHQDKDVNVFKREEQQRLENIIVRLDDERHYAILLCLYTGLRIGEVCALKWENIDLNNNFISIKYSMNRVKTYTPKGNKTLLKIQEPKTAKSKRLLPLPDFMCVYLKRLQEESKGKEFVFILKKTGNPMQPRTLQYVYRRLLFVAGIEYRNFHTLRHTFATRAIELGADVKTVSDVLGHTNTGITINRYTHSLMEQKQNMMQKLNSSFSGHNW